MKRIHSILAIAATVAAFASCAKETFVVPSEYTGNIIPEGKKEIVFSTAITKTTINEGVPAWADKDTVKIIWVEDKGEAGLVVCDTTAAVNPADGTIAAVVGEARDYYYAVYPHWATSTVQASTDGQDFLQVTVRSTSKDGSWASAHYAAALTTEGEKTFNFKSVSNALKFTVNTPGVTKVQIATPDQAMTAAKVRFSFDGEEIGETVEVITPQIASTVTVNGPGTYYAPVICDAQWMSGFVISEYVGDELVSFSEAPNSLCWGRSEIYDIGIAEEHKTATHDWFFKADGTGTGESWDDAAGVEKFIELLAGPTGHLYINGHSLHLAAGEYNLAREGKPSVDIVFPMTTSVNILGGYPADATDTDLTGRDVAENKTIIYSDANITNNRIFLFKGKTGAFTIDGIQFGPYDGIEKSVRGYVMYAQGDADFSADNSLITFSNCTFTGIKGTYYGAIDLNNAAGKMKIENCTFEGNEAEKKGYGGPAIFVENATDMLINNCKFNNNKGIGGSYGGAIVFAGGKSIVYNCAFNGNSSQNYGGAIGVGQYTEVNNVKDFTGMPDVTITKCTFTSNTATMSGAINHCHGNLVCDDCDFTSNTSTLESSNVGGGAISTLRWNNAGLNGTDYPNLGNGTTILNNCRFTDNHSYGRGGAIHHLVDKNGTFSINGCTFTNNYCETTGNGGGAIYSGGKNSKDCSPLYISNSHFSGNSTKMTKSSGNGSGAAIASKTSNAIFIFNSSYTGNNIPKSNDKGNGVIVLDANTKGLFMFRCSLLDNQTNTTAIRLAENIPGVFVNNTFAETENTYKAGIISVTTGGTITALNNILVGSEKTAKSFGDASAVKVASGYNIYGAGSATLTPIGGASDIDDKASADVFVDATPAFDENYRLETKDLSGMMTAPAATTIKDAIKGASEDFYNWLVSIKAFDTMPADNWQCGAYQK